jgi:hypothetical protein
MAVFQRGLKQMEHKTTVPPIEDINLEERKEDTDETTGKTRSQGEISEVTFEVSLL